MIYALKGTIEAIEKQKAMIDVNGVVYEFYATHPEEDFFVGKSTYVYTYEVNTEDEHYLAGFKNPEEKDAFTALIEVKGIGPKTAINALSKTTPEDFWKAVKANNTVYLKKLPGIGQKAASQIILDLKGKLVDSPGKADPAQFDAIRQALKQMGYKNKAIDEALSKISAPAESEEELLRTVLKSLRSK